jgi:hypothetical protein
VVVLALPSVPQSAPLSELVSAPVWQQDSVPEQAP